MFGYIKESDLNLDLSNLYIQPDIKYLKGHTNSNEKLKTHLESLRIQLYQKKSGYILLPYFYKKEEIRQKVLINNNPEILEEKYVLNSIKLREGHQLNCYNKCTSEINNNKFYSGIINLTTSSGKTVLSLKLVEFAKLKTIVIVNKLELLEQWKSKIQQFMPNCRIGIIQGNNISANNCDIVLAMVQTMCINKTLDYSAISSFNFGMCIIDEIHSFPTKLFSNIFFKLNCKYQFGLTATLDRNDNLHQIVNYFLGPIIYSNVDSSLKPKTEIRVYKVEEQITLHSTRMFGEKKLNMSKILNDISCNVARNQIILSIIKELIQDPNRKILCMSDRITQIEYLHSNLDKEISGKFIGKMKSAELAETRKKQVLLASYPLVIQGFDQPDINTLIFCTPRSNIEQAIGRIYRKDHAVMPMIIDFDDTACYVFRNQFKKRESIYLTRIDTPKIEYK